MNLLHFVQDAVRAALTGLAANPDKYVAMVKPAQDARFGDYQANCAMGLAKELGKKPRDVAAEIIGRMPLGDALQQPEIAGPGFINIRLRDDWLAGRLREVARDDRLGVPKAAPPATVIVDFSSPNVAKPMHVGHLRSTIIGDALARLLRFLGHHVITDNHLGDWGTQFGILLYGYKHFRDEQALKEDPVGELARLYKHVRGLMKLGEDEDTADDPIAEAARQETARLHAGDPENVRLWKMFMPWCHEEIDRIYRRLDIRFDHTLGESFYNPMLAEVVSELEEKRVAEPSQGALIIKFGENDVALVRKRDGAFTYTTTDLATIRYRVHKWHPDAMLYVVDFRQSQHFRNLFAAARRWGYNQVAVEHVSFGSVLGEDGKPLKTREGEPVPLTDLLDEAVRQAGQAYEESVKQRRERGQEVPDLSAEELRDLHDAVGLGAVKYADFCQNRSSDYVFGWAKMLAMRGNTATYMQYVYARNRSIFRKGAVEVGALRREPPRLILGETEERALALGLSRFSEALASAAAEYQPSAITAYLWDLAVRFSVFYDKWKVLEAPTPELRQSRLLLCDLTARVIQLGLDLLGIRTVERM
jgi:arginyl-tRNA synthetase